MRTVPVAALVSLPVLGAALALLWTERASAPNQAHSDVESDPKVAPTISQLLRPTRMAGTIAPLVVQQDCETTTALANPLAEPPTAAWRPTATRGVVVSDAPNAMEGLATLVTVGHIDDADVLVDSVAVGVLGLTGEAAAARATLRRIWDELRWPAEQDDVEVIGVGHLDDFPGQLNRADWPKVLTRLEATTAIDVPDGPPLIVLADALPTDRPNAARLAAIARAGRGAGVVVVGRWPGCWSVHHGTDTARLEPLGLDLLPVGRAAAPETASPPDPATDATLLAEPGVEVRVLGPVEIRGAYLGPKETELVAYLALHPDGVTEDQLRTALWPDRVAPRGTFNNVVSLARRHLGRGPSGEPLLPRRKQARYRLHPDVTCDLLTLEHALDAATVASTPDQALDAIADALFHVGGRPFDGWNGTEWPFGEAFIPRAEAAVAAAAHQLVDLACAAGRPAVASAAVAKCLRVVADPLLEDDLRRLPGLAVAEPPPRQLRLHQG